MKAYQKKAGTVKKNIEIINSERIVEMACNGLLNLCVELGFEALGQILEADATALAGSKGKHNANRTAYRHGTETTKVVLGGEKRSISKPRVRSIQNEEMTLPSLAIFQNEEPLNEAILSRLLCGVSTRKYERTLNNQGEMAACVSKSEASRRFIKSLDALMEEFLNRPIEDDFPVIMLDGMCVGGMMVIAALGITKDGHKRMLGIIEGETENQVVVKGLLSDLIERGLSTETPRLFVLDGGKALHKAVTSIFGKNAQIQRCQVHKKRNVLAHLPKTQQKTISLAMSRAYLEFSYDEALKQLETIAKSLDFCYPAAAASLREGLCETLTVHKLKLSGTLRKTLSNTNAIEAANSVAAAVTRRTKKYNNGAQIIRTMGAGFIEAEKGFRRIKGYKDMQLLMNALFQATNDKEIMDPITKLA